jgi:hypothetical protein
VKVLTIWQPWCSLIIAGAKPYEFRRWPAPARLVGQRIVIHAGARPMRRGELQDILLRLDSGETALRIDVARPIVERALTSPGAFPRAAGLGTAVLRQPVLAAELFADKVEDSDRIDHTIWAWPLTEIRCFEPIVPARGLQGFWTWPYAERAA